MAARQSVPRLAATRARGARDPCTMVAGCNHRGAFPFPEQEVATMRTKLIHDAPRTFAVILDTGDEAVACLTAFAREHEIGAAQLTGLGAFRDVTLGYFEWDTKRYRRIPIA